MIYIILKHIRVFRRDYTLPSEQENLQVVYFPIIILILQIRWSVFYLLITT